MHKFEWTNLCGGHHSVTSPAEVWELLGAITKAYWSGIWWGTILHLKLQLVQSGKVVARCWPGKKKKKKKVNRLIKCCKYVKKNHFHPNLMTLKSAMSYSVHLWPMIFLRHWHCPDMSLHAMPMAPPISHWQPFEGIEKKTIIFYIKHVPLCDITLKISASSLTIRWSCFGAHIMQLSFWIWKYLHSTRCQDLSPALQKVPYLNMSAFGCLLKKHFLFCACSWNPRETIFSQKYFFRRRRCQSSNVYYILASRRTKTTTSPHWMHYHTFLKAVFQQGEFILL